MAGDHLPESKGHAGVGRNNLGRHLHGAHGLGSKDYKPLLRALDASKAPILPSLDEFPHPLDGSAPIDDL